MKKVDLNTIGLEEISQNEMVDINGGGFGIAAGIVALAIFCLGCYNGCTDEREKKDKDQ